MFDFSLTRLLYVIPAIIVALSLHEYAHARVSYAFGDPTAKQAGRLTLNPIKHLDIVGTLLLLLAGFGWAKPVPINTGYYGKNCNLKTILVSASGPLMNVLEAVCGAGLIAALIAISLHNPALVNNGVVLYAFNFLQYFVMINVVLAVFNLIPVPPLDGSKILTGLLPASARGFMYILERYGFVILMILAFLGALDQIISPPANWLINTIYSLFGI